MCCREASRLISESLDRELTRRERWSLRAHQFLCGACRRFARQARALNKAVTQAPPAVREALSSGVRLSAERREQIKGLLVEASRRESQG